MTTQAILTIGFYSLLLLALGWPLGRYIARIMAGDDVGPVRFFAPVERAIYRAAGIRKEEEQNWKQYAIALMAFSILGTLFAYLVQRLQGVLPFNPQHFGAVSPDSSLNTAISFVANTNWQGYGGESTMSYFTQMLVLTVQNFVSAATGIAVVVALIRGFARHSSRAIGNFWVDLTRSTLYLLLPLSIIVSLLLVGQGVIQNMDSYRDVPTLEAQTYLQPHLGADGQPVTGKDGKPVMETVTTKVQTIAMGPVASQEAIKMLGTNGGGFFNANSAHPYENPTALSNLIEMLSILLIPVALCFAFGEMVGDRRQGWAIYLTMTILFLALAVLAQIAEMKGVPALTQLGVDQQSGLLQAGGNMEGKETRFGQAATMLFAVVTTVASCGAVNAMHDSLTPLGGMIPMFDMQLGEVVYGGVGAGLYGMLVFAVLAVFIAGLMVGRTPEYLGKKIEVFEMKMTAVVILVTPILVLSLTAIAVLCAQGLSSIANPGMHGFSEILYAYSSAANNNGSAFAGLSANTPFYNITTGLAMWFGRFAIIVPVLAMAGSLAAKKRLPATAGTLPTHGGLFIILLIGTVLLVGALNYVPALALGPVAEHLQMLGIH